MVVGESQGYHFVCFAPHLRSSRLNRVMTKQERQWMSDGHTRRTTHYFTQDGVKRSRGTPELKLTQAYPFSFGCAHALAYSEVVRTSDREAPDELHPSDTEDDSNTDSDDSCLADLLTGQPDYFVSSASVAEVPEIPGKMSPVHGSDRSVLPRSRNSPVRFTNPVVPIGNPKFTDP